MLRARVADAVVHIRAHLTVADETRRALVASEAARTPTVERGWRVVALDVRMLEAW
jgi:hypothetical protein